jgi:hypothetical protein
MRLKILLVIISLLMMNITANCRNKEVVKKTVEAHVMMLNEQFENIGSEEIVTIEITIIQEDKPRGKRYRLRTNFANGKEIETEDLIFTGKKKDRYWYEAEGCINQNMGEKILSSAYLSEIINGVRNISISLVMYGYKEAIMVTFVF